MENELLIIPNKVDVERESIAKVWEENGGEVLRVSKFWIKPDTKDKRISLYGFDSFCLVLAQILELEMLMPKDEVIAELDKKFIKRNIEIKFIKDTSSIQFPKFIKPVIPKLFKAEIFKTEIELKPKIEGIEEDEKIICSDIIQVDAEVRSFILDNQIQDLAFYEGNGSLGAAENFIKTFLEESIFSFPKSFVLDIGFNQKLGWFIIEFNAAWGAGLNFCQPQKVINCIRTATVN